MPFDDPDSFDAPTSDRATYLGRVRASFGVARMYK